MRALTHGILTSLLLVCLAALPQGASLTAAPPKVPGHRTLSVNEVFEVEFEEDAAGPVVLDNPYPSSILFVREAKPSRAKAVAYIIQPKAAGTYRFTLWTEGDKVGKTLPVAYYEFTVGGSPLPPGPPTPPGPPNPPPQPDGAFGLIKVSRDGLATVGLSVFPPLKTSGAKALASNSRTIASAIAAGGQVDPSVSSDNARFVLKTWGDGNAKALTDTFNTTASWRPGWADPVTKAFFKVNTDGKLKTKQDWVDALREIADGLDP